MSNLIRTANCKKCGSVNLKIKPGIGKIDYICADCGKYVDTVNFGKYTTIKPLCAKCSNDIFKVKIFKDDKGESWETHCSKCEEIPDHIYVNADGNIIDANTRTLLMKDDSIRELSDKIVILEEKLDLLEENLSSLESKTDNLNIDVSSLEDENYSIKSNIKSCESDISSLESKVNNLE